MEYNQAAATNVRGHAWRFLVRIGALVAADLAFLWLLREALRYTAATAFGQWMAARPLPGIPDVWLDDLHWGSAVVLALLTAGAYGPLDRRRDPARILVGALMAAALALWSQLWIVPSRTIPVLVATAAALGCALLCGRALLDFVVRRIAGDRLHRTILVGRAPAIGERLGAAQESLGSLSPVTHVLLEGHPSPTNEAQIAALPALAAMHRADTVLLCGELDETTFRQVVRAAMLAECRVLAEPHRLAMGGVRPAVVWDDGRPMIQLRSAALRGQQLLAKRALDIVGALALLACFAPLMLLIAVVIRLTSGGPAVFGQRRLGQHGASFRCLKFRSMYVDAEERLNRDPALRAEYIRNDFKLPEGRDPRITPFGRFLRRTSLDELPQLWNVLRGDMSLVGPRPIVPDEIQHYIGDEHLLLLLKPGLTGSWQVAGRSGIGYPDRAQLELDYVEHWSLTRDLGILLRTIPAVLLQRGAH